MDYAVERLVVKVGTGYIFDSDNGYKMREDQINAICGEIADISNDMEVMIVTSGAIATAAFRLGVEIPEDAHEKAQLAGEGQPYLMRTYQDTLEKYGKRSAQCLICRDDLETRRNRRNLRKNQEGYFRSGVIGIYNENDLIAIDEITFGDNDILAALLASYMDADLLVMLSNPTNGLGTGGGMSKDEAGRIAGAQGMRMEIINKRYELCDGVYQPIIRERI